MRLVSLCACISLVMASTEADDCFPCACSFTTWQGRSYILFADCSSRNLSYIPDINTDIYVLDLSNNAIEADELLKLSRFRFLMVLWIQNIPLKKIPKELPSAISHIRELDLTGNKLDVFFSDSLASIRYLEEVKGLEATYFEENAFQGLGSLKTLDITLSQSNISENIFSDLKLSSLTLRITTSEIFPTNLLSFGKISLSYLAIFAPRVTYLSDMVFDGLSRLEIISLNFESLQSLPLHLFFNPSNENMPTHLLSLSIHGVKSLPRDILRNQQRLESLTLSGVEDLPSGIFDGIQTLHHLNLSTSNVRRVSPYWFNDLGSLKSLNLSHTGLRELGNNSFVGLNSLSVLDISGNHLNSLPESVFQTFRETLHHVNLSDNAISYITEKIFWELFSLLSLDLSHNGIVKISTRSFNHLSKMQILNLRNNSLYYIPEDVLQYQLDLRHLDLSNNSLQSIPQTLLQNAIALRFLDVSNNPVATFPENFLEHSRFLETLNMEGNPLHCDCRLFVIRSQTSGPMLNMTGICVSPEHLKGMSLNTASFTDNCISSTTESHVLTPTASKITTETTPLTSSDPEKETFSSTNSPFKSTISSSSRSVLPNVTSFQQKTTDKTAPSTDAMTFSQTTTPFSQTTTSFYQTTTLTSSSREETSANAPTKPSSTMKETTGDITSEKPVVFEGKDYGGIPSSGMKAFYIAMTVIGTLFVISVTAYVIRRGRLALRSRSYSVNERIVIAQEEANASSNP